MRGNNTASVSVDRNQGEIPLNRVKEGPLHIISHSLNSSNKNHDMDSSTSLWLEEGHWCNVYQRCTETLPRTTREGCHEVHTSRTGFR